MLWKVRGGRDGKFYNKTAFMEFHGSPWQMGWESANDPDMT